MSLPREKCMKCREESDLLLSSWAHTGGVIRFCKHKFCQSCFRTEINDFASRQTYKFTCPCCHSAFYNNLESIDEAIFIGEAATLSAHINPHLRSPASIELDTENITSIDKFNKMVVHKLESALLLNPTNFYTLNLLFISSSCGDSFLASQKHSGYPSEFYSLKLFQYALKLLYHPKSDVEYTYFKHQCYIQLISVFKSYSNYPAALKYSKIAYEECLRSSDHVELTCCKDLYLKSRSSFAKLPPLRFAVGDEVEFLHELETGSEWKLGKVVELQYWDKTFHVSFTSPYRLLPLEDSDSTDEPPAFAWVKADIDRYVRKVGVRSIEDTRYQARLDAKAEELSQVYSSERLLQDIYYSLAQDQTFVDMLQSVWQVELSEDMLSLYRMLVLYREPLVRTDSGYHIPTADEVIAGIKDFFDPCHLSGDAAPSAVSEDNYSQEIRADIISMMKGCRPDVSKLADDNIQGHLLQSIRYYNCMVACSDPSGMCAKATAAISKVSIWRDIMDLMQSNAVGDRLGYLLLTWTGIHICLEDPSAENACECAFVYLLVKNCLDNGWGVPRLALTVYDRMSLQLSREFIRCANPSCEHNRLDKSTGQVKFKQCGGCRSVIYCSRECCVAHYPEHKTLCREHSTGR